jgi:hypothetical protein
MKPRASFSGVRHIVARELRAAIQLAIVSSRGHRAVNARAIFASRPSAPTRFWANSVEAALQARTAKLQVFNFWLRADAPFLKRAPRRRKMAKPRSRLFIVSRSRLFIV